MKRKPGAVTTVSSEYHCDDMTSITWKLCGILNYSQQLDVHKSTDVPVLISVKPGAGCVRFNHCTQIGWGAADGRDIPELVPLHGNKD